MCGASEQSRASPPPAPLRSKSLRLTSSEHATGPPDAPPWQLPALLQCRALYACLAGAALWLVATHVDVTAAHAHHGAAQSARAAPGVLGELGAVPLALVAASCLLRLSLEARPERMTRHVLSLYVSALKAAASFAVTRGYVSDVAAPGRGVVLLSRWTHHFCAWPAVWWLLCTPTSLTPGRRLYVIWLLWTLCVAAALAGCEGLRWPHRAYWTCVSAGVLPEVMRHLWTAPRTPHLATTAAAATRGSHRALTALAALGVAAAWYHAFELLGGGGGGAVPAAALHAARAAFDWLFCSGLVIGVLNVDVLDPAARVQLRAQAAELRMQQERIAAHKAAAAEKDEILVLISNELCGPITGIIGLSRTLLHSRDVRATETLHRMISVVALSGKRLLQFIYSMLTAAQLSTDTLVIQSEEVDIKPLLQDVAMLASNMLGPDVTLELDLQPVPLILGDTGRIVQVLFNLVGNACKCTAAGTVTLATRYDAAAATVAVSVVDTGCGIPAHRLESIFDAYNTGSARATRVVGGNGLGLHLVQELMRAHGGSVEVKSEVGVGSTFTVKFPIRQSRAAPPSGAATPRTTTQTPTNTMSMPSNTSFAPRGSHPSTVSAITTQSSSSNALVPAAAGAPTHGGGAASEIEGLLYRGEATGRPRLLVVGLDRVAPLLATLEGDRMELVQVATASAALERLLDLDLLPDCVLVASSLQDGQGVDFVRELRETFPMFALPVILISPDIHSEMLQLCVSAGCSDFLMWPCSPQEVLWRIRNQLAMATHARQPLRFPDTRPSAAKVGFLPFEIRRAFAALDAPPEPASPPLSCAFQRTAVVHVSITACAPPLPAAMRAC